MLALVAFMCATAGPFVGHTGKPTPAEGAARSLGTWDWAGYRAFVDQHGALSSLVPLTKPDPSPTARYGVNVVVNGRNLSFVLDAASLSLRVDQNANGFAGDDAPIPLTRAKDGAWHGTLGTLRFSLRDDMLSLESAMARAGTVTLPDGATPFHLVSDAAFDEPLASIVIDGRAFEVRRRFVLVRGSVYSATPSGDGATLTLALTERDPACVAPVTVGMTAPHLTALDVDDGRAVLLDFWSPDCEPCMKEMPALEEANTRLGAQQVALIGVSADAADAPTKPAWRQVNEDFDGALHTTFDVTSIPFQVLLDEDGVVRCAGRTCLPEANALVEQRQAVGFTNPPRERKTLRRPLRKIECE